MNRRNYRKKNNNTVGIIALGIVSIFVVIVIVLIAKKFFYTSPTEIPAGVSTGTITGEQSVSITEKVTTTKKGITTTDSESNNSADSSDSSTSSTTSIDSSSNTDSTTTASLPDSIPSGGTTMYTSDYVYLRSAKTFTSESIILGIAKGTAVTVLSDEGGWYKVSYNGQDGYVPKARITPNAVH